MRYKIIEDINISGKGKGDVIEAEPHAMDAYLLKEQVEEIKAKKDAKPGRARKVVSKK